jgi:hypothetical protein
VDSRFRGNDMGRAGAGACPYVVGLWAQGRIAMRPRKETNEIAAPSPICENGSQ